MKNDLNQSQQQCQNIPYSIVALVLGICSILLSGILFIGILLGILGLYYARKANKLYLTNPQQYSNNTLVQIGKVTSILGIVLGSIGTLLACFLLCTYLSY